MDPHNKLAFFGRVTVNQHERSYV